MSEPIHHSQPVISPSEPTHHSHTVVSPKIYALVFGALLIFTALTVYASGVELGVFNAVVALLIAVIKGTLVVLFFMHIKYSSKLVKLTICSGIFTFIVLLALTCTDYISRAWGLW